MHWPGEGRTRAVLDGVHRGLPVAEEAAGEAEVAHTAPGRLEALTGSLPQQRPNFRCRAPLRATPPEPRRARAPSPRARISSEGRSGVPPRRRLRTSRRPASAARRFRVELKIRVDQQAARELCHSLQERNGAETSQSKRVSKLWTKRDLYGWAMALFSPRPRTSLCGAARWETKAGLDAGLRRHRSRTPEGNHVGLLRESPEEEVNI